MPTASFWPVFASRHRQKTARTGHSRLAKNFLGVFYLFAFFRQHHEWAPLISDPSIRLILTTLHSYGVHAYSTRCV
jgi:hypothetical protein